MSTIVFCEDDPSIRKLIATAMRASAHRIVMAADGEEGYALIRQERPDAIFTDVMMPTVTGIELAKRVRAAEVGVRVPIVFMTASVQTDDLAAYSELTALTPLEKPFGVSELRAKVAETLKEVGHGG